MWAWVLLFALEAALLAVYFRDEVRLLALAKRFGLERDGRGYRGRVAGLSVSLPNLRNVDEDAEIRIEPTVAFGLLRQMAEPSSEFDDVFEIEATPDLRYGVWSSVAEARALDLARHGALGGLGVLSLRLPRARRYADAARALEVLSALASELADRHERLEAVLRSDLAQPHPRGIGALEGLMHRGWATESEIEATLVPLLAGEDRTLCERAARLADRHDVPSSVTEALARHAPPDGVWRESSFAGCAARAVVRLGRLTEADAIRWLDAPAPVVDVALDHLAATGGLPSYHAVRASLERVMTKELREHTRAALAKLRERHPTLGEGQLAFSEPEGGELAEAATAGAVAIAEERK